MWNEEKLQEFFAAMEDDEPILKALLSRRLWARPSGDARVLPYLEAALKDTTICVIMIPVTYSEVRHEAALALASERKVQGIDTPVILRQSTGWFYEDTVGEILDKNKEYLKAYYQEIKGDYHHVKKKLNFLRKAGKIELYDFEAIYSKAWGFELKRF